MSDRSDTTESVREDGTNGTLWALVLGDNPATWRDKRLNVPRGSDAETAMRKSMVKDSIRMTIGIRTVTVTGAVKTVRIRTSRVNLCD